MITGTTLEIKNDKDHATDPTTWLEKANMFFDKKNYVTAKDFF
ncbi:MAG: hypothetical protein ABI597_06875 [Gammaproteobacteria bacterium]